MSVKTLRLWARSLCWSRSERPAARLSASMTSRRRPSETLRTHSNKSYSAKVASKESLATSFAQKTTTFSLTLAAPHTVINVVVERVHKTLASDRAGRADALGDDYSSAVAGEEGLRRVLA